MCIHPIKERTRLQKGLGPVHQEQVDIIDPEICQTALKGISNPPVIFAAAGCKKHILELGEDFTDASLVVRNISFRGTADSLRARPTDPSFPAYEW